MNGRRVALFLMLTSLGQPTLAAEEPAYRPVPDWPETPSSIQFGAVSALATDSTDRIFVFHRGEHPIVVFDRDGKFVRSWGDGLVKKAHGLRIDHNDNIWITDIGDHLVRKFAHDGTLLMTLGTKGKPGDGPDQFNQPTDVAVTPSGAFFVTDGYGNARVLAFSPEGRYLKEWGKRGTGDGEFHLPHAICLDRRGRIYVGDRENDRVQIFNPEGKFLASWTAGGAPFGLGLAVDGRLFVADGRANRVTVLDPDGKALTHWGQKGTDPGQFLMPHAACLDAQGDVYVAEINGKRVQKFTVKK
ncbi:peptidyl-alpha-hydroxyglycine alpha-amidating lyase family protein [Singulisphaera sp. GP187]|uniref:peptidyl-alpha-hydroxyglycine alpha-amidating lyase family protein n=1 Tax=Singulisphaera sp. GP187 TaxID=1882752 RepID=UPI000940E0C5|nr:peptidyl-alpha-hydroxyglycine alpha-amidating lyase family protein [Singulisphaera sp. GP187]